MPTSENLGIEYNDRATGQRETWKDGETQVTRAIQCDWDDKELLIQSLLGWQKTNPNGSINRFLPEAHPIYSWLYATQCDVVQPVGVIGQDASYGDVATFDGLAFIDVTYSWLPYALRPDSDVDTGADGECELIRFVERKRSFDVQSLQLPGSTFKFVSDNVKITEPMVKLFPTQELTYIWYKVPSVPWSNISDAVGTVNDASWDLGGDGLALPAETALCLPPVIERQSAADGEEMFRIEYKFAYRPTGWNTFFRGSTLGFDAIIGTDGTTKPYETSDFNDLFKLN